MVLDSQEVKQCVRKLKENEFELAYLATLTRKELKPLSRWEKPRYGSDLELLCQMGLLTKQIRRTVRTGKAVVETIFSVTLGYIQLYEKRFAGKPTDKSTAKVSFEGFLFGFPPCGLDEYIRDPYAKNSLANQGREILFHWACNNNEVTPFILPVYKKMYNLVMGC